MAKFDFMTFTGGNTIEFVVHANKFTKDEALELAMEEALIYNSRPVVEKRYVKYYIKTPDWCGYDGEGGCYTYCPKGSKGSFPVWVITE